MPALLETITPLAHTDPINARILEISEDQIQGFVEDPFSEIAARSGVSYPIVVERIRAMLRTGVIRRVRQTLLATNLAQGALVAWEIPNERLSSAFDFMAQRDPFSGHVVIRNTDRSNPGAHYRLWTTLKVPGGYTPESHCELLAARTGALNYRIMPAIRVFVLGVGHVRRKGMEIGSKSETPAEARQTESVELTELEWRVLMSLKRELDPDEIGHDLWRGRAREAEMPLRMFLAIARELDRKRVIGRFSTFLEHSKPLTTGERVTRFNALFHWAAPPGREIDAGEEIGRHHILTHCYWRDAGPEFGSVNIMAVAHGEDQETVLAHKAAIDAHLVQVGIPIAYTNVFWGGRSEIKPSEISPVMYRRWLKGMQLGLPSEPN